MPHNDKHKKSSKTNPLLKAAQEAARNRRDFIRPSATIFPELYNVDSVDYTKFEKIMANIPTELKSKLPSWMTECKGMNCMNAVSTLAQEAGVWDGGNERANVPFYENPAEYGYKEVSEDQKLPGDLVQFYNATTEQGKYPQLTSPEVGRQSLDYLEPFHIGIFGSSGEGTFMPGASDYYYSEPGKFSPFMGKDAASPEALYYGNEPGLTGNQARKFFRYDPNINKKYGGQIRSYQNGGPTTPPATYDLSAAMDYHRQRLNNPFYQNRLRKEYLNAHGIDLTDAQMSDLISGGLNQINIGGSQAEFLKPDRPNVGGYMMNELGPNAGKIAMNPNFDPSTNPTVALHEIGHRYNALANSPFSSSINNPLYNQSAAYHQSFFNKPFTQGQYKTEIRDDGEEYGLDKAAYFRRPQEIKSYKAQFEDSMKRSGIFDPMQSEFGPDNLRKLLSRGNKAEYNIMGNQFTGLGLDSFSDYMQGNFDSYSQGRQGDFNDPMVPLRDEKGRLLPGGEQIRRGMVGAMSSEIEPDDQKEFEQFQKTLGYSRTRPLTPDNPYANDPSNFEYQGLQPMSNPYNPPGISLVDEIDSIQRENVDTTKLVQGSRKNFRNLFNKGASYKDIQDNFLASGANNIVKIPNLIQRELKDTDSYNKSGFQTYWNREVEKNPEIAAALERMSSVDQNMLDAYNVPYREYEGAVSSISPEEGLPKDLAYPEPLEFRKKLQRKKTVKEQGKNIADFITKGYKEQTGSAYGKDKRILIDALKNIEKGYKQTMFRDKPKSDKILREEYEFRKGMDSEDWMDFVPTEYKKIGENTIQFMNEIAMQDQINNMAKYGGNMKKYNNIPNAGFGDMFKKLGKQIKSGGAGIIEGVTGGLVPATQFLPESQRIAYGDEAMMGSRFGTALGVLGGAGAFKAPTGLAPTTNIGSFASAGPSSSAFSLGNNFGLGNVGSGMFNMYQDETQQMLDGYAMGGKTSMQQNIGQDINVESGELLMSAKGGQFQSMNPKAPIKELMPGVSMVQGNQSNDNVPIKIPDGETMVFSKRLGYADKGLELIQQYKDLEGSPNPEDFIGQQTKKFQLKRIKDKLQKLFKEQEGSKSKKIAQRTGNPQIPGANLGDLFTKGKDFLKSDGFKAFGNQAIDFAKDNPDVLYNLGMGMLGKDPQAFNAADYTTQYNPNPSMTNIDIGAITSPINNQTAATRYAINNSGASPLEIIAANMNVGSKAGTQLASTEARGQMLENQLNLGVYDNMFKAQQSNNLLNMRTDLMNRQMATMRPGFFKEGLSGIRNYRMGQKGEDLLAQAYQNRFGVPNSTSSGTGFNFSLGNMGAPKLDVGEFNFTLPGNY